MAKKRDGELISSIKVIVGLLYFFLIFVCFFYLDKLLFNWIQSGSDSSFYNKLAGFFSAYGRLEWSTLLFSFIFLIFAIDLKNRRKYLNLAKICFLGGILAGISVWPPKTILGRERPRGSGNDSLHYFKFDPRKDSLFYSLPSGHAASSMGSAFPVFMANPMLGTPLVILAILTGWSRIELYEHWPSDVLTGWLIGIISGYWIFKRNPRCNSV